MSDLIDRRAAINALERKKDKNAKGDIAGFYNIIIQYNIDALTQLPSIRPSADVVEKKRGKWIDAKPMSGRVGKVCSACGNEAYWDSDYGQQLFDWCPNCGAQMDVKETEDE